MKPSGPSILVVDDEVDICRNLSDILSDLGYQVDVAHDGPSALELVRKNRYDVALLDLKMPGMDGLTLYREIKRLRAGTVAIIVSAYATSATAEEALTAGAWHILSKPLHFPHVLRLLKEAIDQPLVLVVDDDQDLCANLWCSLHRSTPRAEESMARSLRIAVADDEVDMRQYFETVLPLLGHQVVVVAEDGRSLVQKCATANPDLVITDIKMPDMDGIDAATQICRNTPVPVILVSAFHDDEFIRRAEADHILAYLVKPVKQADLEPAIAIAMRRFEQFQSLRKEAASLKQALEDRKIIEKAKGILMKKAGLDEHDAFRRLQKLSSDKNRKLVEIANMILTAEEALGGN